MRDESTRYALGPALEFLESVWMTNHALERVSLRMERQLGITAQQRLLLRCVGKYPGITAGQMAAIIHLDRGTVSAALRRLEGKGLLERRKDPRDGRRVNLGLTPRGREYDRPTEHTVEDVAERLVREMRAEHVATAKAVLRRLTELLHAEADSP